MKQGFLCPASSAPPAPRSPLSRSFHRPWFGLFTWVLAFISALTHFPCFERWLSPAVVLGWKMASRPPSLPLCPRPIVLLARTQTPHGPPCKAYTWVALSTAAGPVFSPPPASRCFCHSQRSPGPRGGHAPSPARWPRPSPQPPRPHPSPARWPRPLPSPRGHAPPPAPAQWLFWTLPVSGLCERACFQGSSP